MQNIKKYFMMLALLLTAVTGAWAQSSLNVVEIEVPAGWETDESNVTAADLPGFKTSTLEEAKAWKGASADDYAVLFYAFDGDDAYYVLFEKGVPKIEDKTRFKKSNVFSNSTSMKFYYTGELTEWSLKPDETGKTWTLAKMPASDIELQVEYYPESNIFLGKEALADKANISVLNGETAVAFDDDGKSTTTVTEGNTVTAKFSGKKVLGMKVEKKSAYEHSITIAVDPSTTGAIATAPAMTIEFNTGEKWADVAARYDWLGTYEDITVYYKGDKLTGDVHDANGGVKPGDTIDSNGSYHWGM